jgi:Xaa-Pro aminopeptidase
MINAVNFKTEKDILSFIKQYAVSNGLELAFEPVVATGINSSMPHNIASATKLNGFTVIDLGLKYKGYCSDMTRMMYFGVPSKSEINAFSELARLQDSILKRIKPGMKFSFIDKIARDALKNRLLHSTGHGLGVEIHEKPVIAPKSKLKLKSGMVFTIEPGLYIRGKFGLRIEDTVAFYENKVHVLTKSRKDLLIVSKKSLMINK